MFRRLLLPLWLDLLLCTYASEYNDEGESVQKKCLVSLKNVHPLLLKGIIFYIILSTYITTLTLVC